MEEHHENVYLSLMTKKILQEKYKDEISFATGSGKSDVSSTLTEAWINKRKVSKTDEAERIIKTAAQLRLSFILPQKILRTHRIGTACITKFIKELVKSSEKQNSLFQAIFAASKPKAVFPLCHLG